MALTNPTNLVDLQGLERFKQKLDPRFESIEAATIIPVNLNTMTPSTTFVQNEILFLNGVGYRAKKNTTHFPVVLVVQDGQFVVDIVDGAPAFVISNYTLDEDWEVWGDASVNRTLANMQADLDEQLEQIQSGLDADVADINANVNQTLQQIQSGLDSEVAAIEQDQAAFITEAQAVVGQSLKSTTRIYNTAHTTSYTVQQLLTAMADLMGNIMVVHPSE